ncbi:unnamed protein product, partial [Timema podura]|nr:unnamed protein product [Timema podura]
GVCPTTNNLHLGDNSAGVPPSDYIDDVTGEDRTKQPVINVDEKKVLDKDYPLPIYQELPVLRAIGMDVQITPDLNVNLSIISKSRNQSLRSQYGGVRPNHHESLSYITTEQRRVVLCLTPVRDITPRIEPESMPSVVPRIVHISLKKEEGSLGLTLRGGVHPDPLLCRPLVITYVRPGGPAHRYPLCDHHHYLGVFGSR